MASLYDRVRLGQIKMTLVLGPPRSVSTAIALALSQSPDFHLYIHEPFSNKYSAVPSESTCAKIISSHVKRLERGRAACAQNPLHILIKESSNHLPLSHFRRFAPHCENVIIIIRSPLLQLSSVVRICQWIWAGCPARSRVNTLKLESKDVHKFSKNDDLKFYFVKAWQRLAKQVDCLDHQARKNRLKKLSWIVLDAELSRTCPNETLKQVSRHLNIRFSSKMITGWDKNSRANLEYDEWSRRASLTRRLHSVERHFLGMDAFPQNWHSMIIKAFAVYVKILRSRHLVLPRALCSFQRLVKAPVESDLTLADAVPDTCYALAGRLPVSSATRSRIRGKIRDRHPQHPNVFQMLDNLL